VTGVTKLTAESGCAAAINFRSKRGIHHKLPRRHANANISHAQEFFQERTYRGRTP
jgi:hypothetical protein